MPEVVDNKAVRFLKSGLIVTYGDTCYGMTPLGKDELTKVEAMSNNKFMIQEGQWIDPWQLWTLEDDAKLVMFDSEWHGVVVFKSDLGTDRDLFDWTGTKIYRIEERD